MAGKLKITAFRRNAEQCGRLVRQVLEDVALEEQPRLRMIHERGPWDYEREAAQLQQKRHCGMMQ